jgi:hypothetical protein
MVKLEMKPFEQTIFIPYNLAYHAAGALGMQRSKKSEGLFKGMLNHDSLKGIVKDHGYEFDNKCALIGFQGPMVYLFIFYDSNAELRVSKLSDVEDYLQQREYHGKSYKEIEMISSLHYSGVDLMLRVNSILMYLLQELKYTCETCASRVPSGWQYIEMSWDSILEDYSGFNEIGLAQVTSKYGKKSWDSTYVQDGKVYKKEKEA